MAQWMAMSPAKIAPAHKGLRPKSPLALSLGSPIRRVSASPRFALSTICSHNARAFHYVRDSKEIEMAATNGSTVTLMATGDVGPIFEPTEKFVELIAPVLKQADVRLGQCERTYSERGADPQFTDGPGQQSGAH